MLYNRYFFRGFAGGLISSRCGSCRLICLESWLERASSYLCPSQSPIFSPSCTCRPIHLSSTLIILQIHWLSFARSKGSLSDHCSSRIASRVHLSSSRLLWLLFCLPICPRRWRNNYVSTFGRPSVYQLSQGVSYSPYSWASSESTFSL